MSHLQIPLAMSAPFLSLSEPRFLMIPNIDGKFLAVQFPMKSYHHLILSLLLGCSAANSAQFPISSTFDNGAPGDWVQMNINSLGMDAETDVFIDIPFEEPDSTTPPAPAPEAGLLSFYDMDNGDWGFVNSGKFAGNLSAAFGGTLSFTQRWGTLTPGGDPPRIPSPT